MSDLNGVEVVRQIRSAIGEDTPIIILTAYDWTEIEEEARKAGVTAFCAKPLFLSDLYEILNASVEAEPIHPDRAKSNVHLKGSRILLVEDNDLNREIAAAILPEMDVQVEEAKNGKVAVEMVRSSAPGYYGMVLMDIQMPVMDGYEAPMRSAHWTGRMPLPFPSLRSVPTHLKRIWSNPMNESIKTITSNLGH